jgi:hypothetical protein
VSISSTAELSPAAEPSGSGRSWFSLALGMVLLVGALLLVISGQLVRLENDKNHQPLLPGTLATGESASGELTLTNPGVLPIEVSLEPRLTGGRQPSTYPSQVTLAIRAAANGRLLYEGPLRTTTGDLLHLRRGESVRLQVTLTAVGSKADATTFSLPYSYYWTARGALPWWWWLPATAAIVVLLMLGYWRPWRQRLVGGVR